MAYSILIVDDDIAIKESVEEYLKILNYDVASALNADKALEILTSFKADIVLTDIMMQGMDGLELTRRIKESYDADVMVMTGYSAEYSYEEAVRAGASDFIFKPFRFEELDLRIKRVLREAEFKNERTKLLKELEKLA
ncbi:MAG: response regulator, partial [Desulfobacula sp.]|nr:response regulator [Desulfobacula sp.]